ncbi:uncharacterized protein JCM6883_002897 [Sporobolomyces salmoneus]|uniref:uncharacterized protein n=1 Tax=Sporobolomyces salmoneus TaxID=183962 RepID=UPI00316D61A8
MIKTASRRTKATNRTSEEAPNDPNRSGSEQSSGGSANEPMSEVVARRQAARLSDPRVAVGKPKLQEDLYKYLDELLDDEDEYTTWWSDPSVSDTVREFIDERDEIFALQKSFNDYDKEHKAILECTTARPHLEAADHRNYLDELAPYIAFCRIIRLNPFSISTAVIAVYLYQYRWQWPEESRARTFDVLKVFERWTNRLYETGHRGYRKLDQWYNAKEVVKELQKTIQPAANQTRPESNKQSKEPIRGIKESASEPSTASKAPAPRPEIVADAATLSQDSESARIEPSPVEPNSNHLAENDNSIPPPPSQAEAKTSVRRNIPLPGVGDRFESLRAVKMASAASIMFSQGFEIGTVEIERNILVYCRGPGMAGRGCSFRINATFDELEENWKVEQRIATHTHAPSAPFVNNPEWRLSPTDPDFIEVIKQVDEKGRLDGNLRRLTQKRRLQCGSIGSQFLSKRSRISSPPPQAQAQTPTHSTLPTESVIVIETTSEFTDQATSASPPRFAASDSNPSLEPSIANSSQSNATLSSPTSASQQPVSTPILPSRPHAKAAATSRENLFFQEPQRPRPALDLTLPPVSGLVHFLTSIDPSLSPLAPLFQAAGYSTLSSLVEFVLLSERVRKLVYREILARLPPELTVDERLFDLLERKLVEASEANWTS